MHAVSRIIPLLSTAIFLSGCADEMLPEMICCNSVSLVRIPPGARLLGTDNSRAESEERGRALFRLNYPLYFSDTELTNGQLRILRGEHQREEDYYEPARLRPDEIPAVLDAFRVALERQTGRRWEVRVPYEDEWEYAAMYGRPANEDWWPTYPTELDGIAWMSDNSGNRVHNVGEKYPNQCGLHDMLGNVEELCQGIWTPSVAEMLRRPRVEPGCSDPNLVARGGRYDSIESWCRPTRRHLVGNGLEYGVRVAAIPR